MGLVVLIKRAGFELASYRKVIKRDDCTVVQEAEAILAAARQEAAAIIESARRLQERAAEMGYEQGQQQALSEMSAAIIEAEAMRTEKLAQLEEPLARVVLDALGQIAREIDREQIFGRALDVVRNALAGASWANVIVHPAQADAARAAVAAFEARTRLVSLLRVRPDDSVSEDACLIESDFGSADASLDTQLGAIQSAVHRAAASIASAATPRMAS